jgi:hypothetical protein
MPENDSVDILTAFAIGAMIGVGATLLLRSEPETTSEKVLKQLRPIGRTARKAAGRAGRHYGKSIREARRATSELGAGGKEVIDDLQQQIEDVLASAREELGDAARRQLKLARKKIRSLR